MLSLWVTPRQFPQPTCIKLKILFTSSGRCSHSVILKISTWKEEDRVRYLNILRTVKGASKDWPQSLTIKEDPSAAVYKNIISTQEYSHQSAS